MSVYSNIWITEETRNGTRYIIPDRLYQQLDKVVVAGENISHHLIKLTYASKDELLTGGTIISKAKETLKETRKIVSLLQVAIKLGILT